MEQKPLKTREQVIAEFNRRGQSVRSWALSNGLNPAVVSGVLAGRYAGRIGESHRAAVKLGLKDGEII